MHDNTSPKNNNNIKMGDFVFVRKQDSKNAFKRVQRVSKRAALASKRKIWDSNTASIEVALSAVDQWESLYSSFKHLLVTFGKSAKSFYETSKDGAESIEHHLLVPVRDYILMPAFFGAERVVTETSSFLTSQQAVHHVADCSLSIIRRLPLGEQVFAPVLVASVTVLKEVWCIIQYPIPSRRRVVEVTDHALTATKWALGTTGYSIYMYAKMVDATITRTLMHTQWRILNSGPYATLDERNRQEVLDHVCERYFALREDAISRYELVAHIKANNRRLYVDLVLSGLLQQRGRQQVGGTMALFDVWLTSPLPIYRRAGQMSVYPWESLLLPPNNKQHDANNNNISCCLEDMELIPLWFYLPSREDGKKTTAKEVPWVPFLENDARILEQSYISYMHDNYKEQFRHEGIYSSAEGSMGPLCHALYDSVISTLGLATTTTSETSKTTPKEASTRTISSTSSSTSIAEKAVSCALMSDNRKFGVTVESNENKQPQHHTVAKWYDPDVSKDTLVDQKRYAVSFLNCDNNCCIRCSDPSSSCIEQHTCCPCITMIRRPTLWRFHGKGDEVRRATWFMDTMNGLQPYFETSAAVLEDAYLFLKWYLAVNQKRRLDGNVLLTVQVMAPDGEEQQLVQFASLTKITAVQKTLLGALSLFKSRVYRGACIQRHKKHSSINIPVSEKEWSTAFEQSIAVPVAFVTNNKSVYVTRSVSGNIHVANDNNVAEDKIEHLVLVVHGIGEMMRSVDIFGLGLPGLSSLVTCCDWMRSNHAEVLSYQAAAEVMQSEGRVEYIPVEWHEAFALQSRRTPFAAQQQQLQRGVSPPGTRATTPKKETPRLEHISLNTIPGLRSFVNDTLLDVLYFLSPEYHEKIISIVTAEMNLVFSKFQQLSGDAFSSGRVSIVGHSLGSVITWDILAHQMALGGDETYEIDPSPIIAQNDTATIDPNCCLSPIRRTEPSSPRSVLVETTYYPQLSFSVFNTFMIGSPISVFLMIRNQHQPMGEGYSLPGCKRVFNIFHPYDPAAYRLEPLLDKHFSFVEPVIISHWRGGLRVQYQTKMVWNIIVNETRKAQRRVVGAVESAVHKLGLLDGASADQEEDLNNNSSDSEFDDEPTVYVHCGKLNQGRRIDYMLQEKEFEHANEYVFAIGAHSGYW
jgi:hypothetical protein